MMALIYVKTVAGRRAFAGPGLQNEIPSDRFVPVQNAQHILRLINVHGDLEVKPEKAPGKEPEKAAKTSSKTSSAAAREPRRASAESSLSEPT